MSGSLLHFSVQNCRKELSQEISLRAPARRSELPSLIRAAGHDNGADRAFQLLEKLKDGSRYYNIVLDACLLRATSPMPGSSRRPRARNALD